MVVGFAYRSAWSCGREHALDCSPEPKTPAHHNRHSATEPNPAQDQEEGAMVGAHVAQGGERLVDGLRLLEALARRVRGVETLRTREVDEVQHAAQRRLALAAALEPEPEDGVLNLICLLYTSPSPRDRG